MKVMQGKVSIFFLVLFLVVVIGLSALFLRDFNGSESAENEKGLGTFVTLVTTPDQEWYSIRDLSENTPVSVLPEFDGRVVDYTTNNAGEALIYNDSGTHVVQVRTTPTDDWYVISRSPNEKRDIALSNEGHYVAYAELNQAGNATDLSSWGVYFFDRITNDLFSAGIGHRPHFLVFNSEVGEEWEALTFTSPDSVVTVPVVAREEDGLVRQDNQVYFPTNLDEILYFSSNSAPGKTIAVAYNSLIDTFDIFNIPASYFDLEFIGTVDADSILGVSGSSILVEEERNLYVYSTQGSSSSELIRETNIGDAQRIIKVITSEYE